MGTMSFRVKRMAPMVAAAIGAASTASVANDQAGALSAYDFRYSIAGDSKVTPIQVFDDGAQTFFQFRRSDSVPAIFRINQGRQELTDITPRSPYVIVPGVAERFALRSGTTAIASVDYVGAKRNAPALPTARAAVEAEIQAAAVRPVVEAGAEARVARLFEALMSQTPNRGSRLAADIKPTAVAGVRSPEPATKKTETLVPFVRGRTTLGPIGTKIMNKLAREAAGAAQVQITGRGDPRNADIASQRASALKAFFTSRGIPADKIRATENTEARAYDLKDVYASEVALLVTARGPAEHVLDAAASKTGRPDSAASASQVVSGFAPLVTTTIALLNEGKLTREAAAAILESTLLGVGKLPLLQRGPSIAGRTHWEIAPEDATLRNALSKWAGEAGWQLSWDMPYDYPIRLRAAFEGNFEQAIAGIAKSFQEAEVPIAITFYRGNRVLRVVAATEQGR